MDYDWTTFLSDLLAGSMLTGAVVLFYFGRSDARARQLLQWMAENLKVPAFFWGLSGLIGLVLMVYLTVFEAHDVFVHRKAGLTNHEALHGLLVLFSVGAVLAGVKTVLNATRFYAAGRAPREDRLRVLSPLSKFRQSERISSPSVRYLVFILSLFFTIKFWLGTVEMFIVTEPLGRNVLAHVASMSFGGLALGAYVSSNHALRSPASMSVGFGLRIVGTAGCILALSLWGACLALLFRDIAPGWAAYRAFAPFGMFLAGYTYNAGQDVFRASRRHLTKIIRDPARLEGESFVLYLRPFANDALQESPQRFPWRGLMPFAGLFVTGRSEEERIAAALKRRVAPLVAVGEPGEVLPYVGATRMYLPVDNWHEPVRDLMRRTRLAVLTLGPGEGTMWELREALHTLPPERLVLLVTMEREPYREFRQRINADLKKHDVRVRPRSGGEAFVPKLPASTSDGSGPSIIQGAICFTPEWTAEYVDLAHHARKLELLFDWLPHALKAGLRPALKRLAAYEFAKQPRLRRTVAR